MKLPETTAKRVRLAVIVVAVAAGLWLLEHQLGSLDLEDLLHDLSQALGDWTYLLVGAFAFLETGAFVGLVVPGETVIMLGGAVAGQGETSIELTVAIVWLCAWAGDTTSFFIGRRLGREFILRHGPRVRITRERFEQVESYFRRYGGRTILIGRFIGLVRALAPFTAGTSGMQYRAFVPYSILGTGAWAAAFSLIGYFASQSLNQAKDLVGKGLFLFALTIGVIVGIVLLIRFLRVPENRERVAARMEGNRVLHPLVGLGRRAKPQARFVWNRVTPGELGLQFTALMAALAVATYVLVAYAVTVSGDPGPTAGDTTALDAARDIHSAWLTDVAKAITTLGSAVVMLPVALVAGIWLAARGHWIELAVLGVAVLVIFVGVDAIKAATDRPRPPDPLAGSSGSAYPSGHAAHAVLYAWLALTATVRLRPGRAGGSALIAVGIALTVAVGLSRVYLRVHYMSDVSGGWALGVAAFALCAAVAMIVTHLGRAQSSE
jgi:membrane protein DedA with SNARE-associated domain/membrane-associated phospholipid phosphatase